MRATGYLDDATRSATAFDEEGFFKTGDAALLANADHPERGLRYDGRFGEQFKLTSATFVATATLRVRSLAAFEPLLRELGLCGENQDHVTSLAWLNETGVRSAFPHLVHNGVSDMLRDDRLMAALREKLRNYNDANTGSSRRIERILLSRECLSFDFNEITDKGSINMRRIWQRRSAELERLFSPAPDDFGDMVTAQSPHAMTDLHLLESCLR